MLLELCESVLGTPVQHLNAQLFEEAVEYALRDFTAVQLQKISVELGSSAGDNYLGIIYRAKVKFQRIESKEHEGEQLSLIVKCIPRTEANEFLHDANVFLKEILCYRDVLPRLEVLSTGKEKFGALLYHAIKQPIKTLVFEDLNVLNYRLASRETGLDEAHAVVVLKKLAKFHAMSMLLGKKDPDIMHGFHSGLVSKQILKDNGLPLRYYGAEIMALEATIRSWQGYEKIADKIHKYRLNLCNNLCRSIAPLPDDICVLNHGDLWVNNILFKYQRNKQPEDVVFVDFQMSIWRSLGIDLNYFFNSSLQLQVLQTRRLHLLCTYYEALSATLAEHNHLDMPSFEEVQQQVRNREAWGFFAAFAILPLISLEKTAASDNNLDNMANEEFAHAKIMQMYQSPRVQETMKYSLKRFDQLGVFD